MIGNCDVGENSGNVHLKKPEEGSITHPNEINETIATSTEEKEVTEKDSSSELSKTLDSSRHNM